MKKKQFKAESKRLLDLMINSIYTHKEIFLRELISNASDAIDKLSFIALTDDKVGLSRSDFEIRLIPDRAARTLTVRDNGIGMSEEELDNNLGVIARSGSLEFMKNLGDDAKAVDIIGQFGVGFYSAFMVADEVTVISRKYGEDEGHMWRSNGADGYTIEACEKESAGTDVILHLKEDGEEPNEYSQYLEEYTLSGLVKKYSNYIRFPVRMDVTRSEKKPDSPEDKPEYEDVIETETLNSMVPLWQKNKSEVTKEEYDRFYQDHFNDYAAPQSVITVAAEGAVEFKALLFIPSQRPALYFSDEYKAGLQLYSSGVMIMDKCEDLLPDCFNFVRGVVDSQDLSLNISREMLQHNRQLKIIATNLEKKIKAELKRMLENEREEYEKFYGNFGRQLKLSLLNSYGAKKDLLEDLLMFYSSGEKKLSTLEEYVGRMPEEQKYIYYAAGKSLESLDNMPQTELVKEHGMEILYLVDTTDEFLPEMLYQYKEKPFRSIVDDDLGFEDVKKPEEAESGKAVLDFLKETLGEKVDEVKASAKLKTHPVCLSSGQGISFEMENYFAAVQPDMKMKAKRILELNTEHEAFKALEKAITEDPEKAKKYAEILYNQALLIAGLPLENPSAYTDLLCSLWN